MAINALLLPHDDDRFALRTAFDRDFVEALKLAIPAPYREWSPEKKTWYIHQEYDTTLTDLVESRGGRVMDKRPVTALAAVIPGPLREACALLCVSPDAPISVAEAAFKAQAKRHHPDVGGDTEMMQRLNNALATFKSFTEEAPF
jgi:hypothetical protein